MVVDDLGEQTPLREYGSPGQIIGFMRQAGSRLTSHQWSYELIYRDKATGGDLWRYCRQPGQRRYQRRLAKRAGSGAFPTGVGSNGALDLV